MDRNSFLSLDDGLYVMIATMLIRTHPQCVHHLQRTCKRLCDKVCLQAIKSVYSREISTMQLGEDLTLGDVKFFGCSMHDELVDVQLFHRAVVPLMFAVGPRDQVTVIEISADESIRFLFTRPRLEGEFSLEVQIDSRFSDLLRFVSFGGEIPGAVGSDCILNYILVNVDSNDIFVYGTGLKCLRILNLNIDPNAGVLLRVDVPNIKNILFFQFFPHLIVSLDVSSDVQEWRMLRNLPMLDSPSGDFIHALKLAADADGTLFRSYPGDIQKFVDNEWILWMRVPYHVRDLFVVKCGDEASRSSSWVVSCTMNEMRMDYISTVSVHDQTLACSGVGSRYTAGYHRTFACCGNGLLISFPENYSGTVNEVIIYKMTVREREERRILVWETIRGFNLRLLGEPRADNMLRILLDWNSSNGIMIKAKYAGRKQRLFVSRYSRLAQLGLNRV